VNGRLASILVVVLANGVACPGAEPARVRFGVIDPPVVAQYDITVRAPTSNHPQDPTPLALECSGLAWLGDDGQAGELLVTSDRHQHAVFTVPLDPATLTFSEPAPRVVVRNETELAGDVEAVALQRTDGARRRAYLFSSMSHDPNGEPAPDRRRMARFDLDAAGQIDPASVRVLSANAVRAQLAEHFEALRVPTHFTYTPSQNRNTDRWANVEGVGFIPGRSDALLCGFRNPLAQDEAIFAAIEDVDAAFDARDPALMRVTDLFRLDLGGRGVADLCWDPVTRGYLLVAGKSNGPKRDDSQPYPLTDLDSAVFWWSGDKADRPVLIAQAVDMNIEAVCRVGDTPLIALGTDEGDVSEARTARQSVIVLMVFTGVDAYSPLPFPGVREGLGVRALDNKPALRDADATTHALTPAHSQPPEREREARRDE